MIRVLASCLLPLCLASVGAQIVVDPGGGGDFTTLQPAIDAAAPFTTIRVVSGSYGPVTIDRTLTIVGDPRPTIRAATTGPGFVQPPAVSLSGSGSDRIVFQNVELGGSIVDGNSYSAAGSPIAGSGFAQLQLADSTVRAPEWFQVTGTAHGVPAIDVDFALSILLVRCDVAGSMSPDDPGANDVFPFDGPVGIDAPGANVLVIDSEVLGGGAGETRFVSIPPVSDHPCPCIPASGNGGAGILAQRVFSVQSLIRGGEGSEVFFLGEPYGHQLDGVPVIATTHTAYAQRLSSTRAPRIGEPFDVFVSPTLEQSATLLFGAMRVPPLPALGADLFLDPLQPITPLSMAASQSSFRVSVPNDTDLIGTRFGLQLAEVAASLTLSNPVIEVITF